MIEKSDQRSAASLAIGLVVALVLCFSAAGVGGVATASSVGGWFTELNKPSWNPPSWIFGPVWTLLYFMMAISAWLIWKEAGFTKARFALFWFAFHLVLNVLWSVLFFGLQRPGWAAIEIVALWLSILLTIVLFSRHSKLAAALLVPYICWVSFATLLNIAIWSLN